MRFQTEPLGFQRNRTATGEGIVERRQLVGIEQLVRLRVTLVHLTGLAPTLADLHARRFQHGFVVGVLPFHQLADDRKQSLALNRGFFLVDAAGEALPVS